MLTEAQAEILDKENEIMRLTKDLVEIRLNKANPEDMKDSQTAVDGHITSTTMEDRGSSVSTNGAWVPSVILSFGHLLSLEPLTTYIWTIHKR